MLKMQAKYLKIEELRVARTSKLNRSIENVTPVRQKRDRDTCNQEKLFKSQGRVSRNQPFQRKTLTTL